MPVIKKVLNIIDLRLENLDRVTAQITDYLSDLPSIEYLDEIMLCLYQDDAEDISVLSNESDLECLDLSDPNNLLEDADCWFSVREFVSLFYTVERLKKDLNDLIVYKLIPSNFLFLF